MNKYKLCPHCRRKNAPDAWDCECGADISSERVTDDENEKAISQTTPKTADASARAMVRICDNCGKHNPANARRCTDCGEDISDVIPVEECANKPAGFILASDDGEYAYNIPDGETVIGRESAMSEYLSVKSYVSRRHAKLTVAGGKLSIENLSGTNYTFVNNERIPAGAMELHEGDTIGLGGNITGGKKQDKAAYFTVRVVSCS